MGPCAAAVVAILLVATCVAAAPPLQQHHKPGRISSGACPASSSSSSSILNSSAKSQRSPPELVPASQPSPPSPLRPALLEIQIWPRGLLLPTAMPARSAPESIALPAGALPRAASAPPPDRTGQLMAPPRVSIRVSCSLPRPAPPRSFRLVCTQLGNWNWQRSGIHPPCCPLAGCL